MRKAAAWALIAAVGFVPLSANAATYSFDFSTLDSLFSVTGVLTVADTPDVAGGYDMVSLSGTISGPGGGAIALAANPWQPFTNYTNGFMYDNVFFPGGAPLVDAYGMLFTAGGYDYNLYATGASTYNLSTNNPAGVYNPGLAAVFSDPARIDAAGAAPEPSTWALMLLGFAGLAVAAGRRARRNAAPAVASVPKA